MPTSSPLSTDRRSARISSAVWYRATGSFRIALATTASSDGDTSALSELGRGASVDVLEGNGHRAVTRVGGSPGEHLIEHDA